MGIEAFGYTRDIRIASVACATAGTIGDGLLDVPGVHEAGKADGIG